MNHRDVYTEQNTALWQKYKHSNIAFHQPLKQLLATSQIFILQLEMMGKEFRRVLDPGTRSLLPGRIRVVAGSGM